MSKIHNCIFQIQISPWRAALRKKLFWTFLLQISQLKNDQNFTLLRPPPSAFSTKKSQKNSKKLYLFFLSKNLGSFASSKKGMNTFHYEMSKKWIFTFMNFQNVYWHGKTHSAMHSQHRQFEESHHYKNLKFGSESHARSQHKSIVHINSINICWEK